MTPERQRLAEAIVVHREAEMAHGALVAADAWDGAAAIAARTARESLEAAQEALGQAQTSAVDRLVAASLGDAKPTTMTVRDARAAVQAAEDDLAAATAARETIRGRIGPAEKALGYAAEKVDNAALAVLRAEVRIDDLLDRLEALHREAGELGRTLEWLTTNGGIPRSGPEANPRAPEICSRFWAPPGSWVFCRTKEQSPSTMAFVSALAALKTDASVAIPSLDVAR